MSRLHFWLRKILKCQCRYCRYYMPHCRECSINIGVWGETLPVLAFKGGIKTNKEEILKEIEAEPVRHGTWKHKVIDGFIPDYDCVCSECGASGVPDYKHCPNCGAKMDLEESE